MKKIFLLAVIPTLPLLTHAALLPDRASFAYGQFFSPFTNRHAEIDQYRLGLAWELSDELWSTHNVLIQSYVELALSQWRSRLNPTDDIPGIGADRVKQISLSPVFRFTSTSPLFAETSPFLDLGVSVSYQSKEDIEQQHPSGINMGGHWQFETRAMVGLNLGESKPFEVSYGWMHYSNAYLNDANEGLDFQTLQMTYLF
ncbi:acyloxyacyl hydrolase [Endozoicomonas sp. SCSIO W0465]|uniref:acyloxyacyl hydrolase n=1 Tax=Endozoicomonas sp. SCSIO W0465 TaxID=2918516 RepID=UPI00207654E3|nr:acyloxyacyl hydrolase [Endozoicomonas sp. SCSIO W0465]USE35055.1 acyloxyacyl hydrolase [Endozoicomonas sp. SCSIO W0465]